MLSTNSNAQLEVAFQKGIGSLAISTYNTATEIVNPPNIDTGGFFGPVVKFFINGAVWIYQNLLLFFAFVVLIIETSLNAIGRALNIGNIGTQLIAFLNGIATFLNGVFGPAIALIGNLANQLISDINVITLFFSQTIWLTWISEILTNIGNSFALIVTVWNQFVSMFSTTIQAANYFFILFYIYGMYEVYMNGTRGLKHWLDIGATILTGGFKAGWWIAKESWTVLLTIKQLVVQWI